MKKYLIPILSALIVGGFIFAASSFPTSLDNLATVSTGDIITAAAWNDMVGAINNLQTKLGINNSTVLTTIDSLVKNSSSTLYRIAKTDGGFVVGDGTDWALETGATARASMGIINSNWKTLNVNALIPTSTIGIIVSASSTFTGDFSLSSLISCDTIDTDSSGKLACGSDQAGAGGGSNWQFIGINAIRPTSTVGIIVQASSTIGARLNMESNAVFNASTTLHATTTFDIMPVLPEDYILNKLFEPATTTFSVAANTTTTLDRDVYYTSTTIAVGGTLRTNGYRLFVSGELVNNGNIENNGSNGTSSDPSSNAVSNASTTGTMRGGNPGVAGRANKSGAGGPGGGIVFIVADTLTNNGVIEANGGKGRAAVLGGSDGAGNAAAPCLACKGGNGGKGGNSEAQVGGAGSVITQDKQDFRDIFRAMDMWSAANATGTGAGGGGGGGAESITGNNSSGGGGGGGGGFVVLFYNTFNDSGTEQAEGGPGGAGFATGDTGTAGAVGIILKVDMND